MSPGLIIAANPLRGVGGETAVAQATCRAMSASPSGTFESHSGFLGAHTEV